MVPSQIHFHCTTSGIPDFFFLIFSRAAPAAYGGFQDRGLIGAIAAGLHHSHSNARSLTHWTMPRVEHASSWMLVRFLLLSHNGNSLFSLFFLSSPLSVFFFCLFAFSRATPMAYGDSQARGPIGAVAEPQQRGIQATSATYTTAHGNARSLTHWARPGIEPTTSWFLVRFVSHWATTGTPTTNISWANTIY